MPREAILDIQIQAIPMKQLTAFSLSLILIFVVFATGCETFCGKCYCETYDARSLPLNDTFEMKFGEVYCNGAERIRIAFDSLYGDGRCPIGVYCVWEGNARVHFTLEDKKEGTSEFILNTSGGLLTDTTIHGIVYELINLDPYPIVDVDYKQEVYTATMLISH